MNSCHTHRHKNRSSAKGKGLHKDANDPKHKDHAKGRDKFGERNAPDSRQYLNEVSYDGVEGLKEWLAAEEVAAVDSRGRPRENIGFSVIHSVCDDLQAPLNALLDVTPERGAAVVRQHHEKFKHRVRERFPEARSIFGRHLDKIRIHSEVNLLKYDETGKKLKRCEAVDRDGPGVTALASQAAVRCEKIKLGKAGRKWNSRMDIELSLELQVALKFEINHLSPIELEQFDDRLKWWKAELAQKISKVMTQKRLKKKELEEFELALAQWSDEGGLGAAEVH